MNNIYIFKIKSLIRFVSAGVVYLMTDWGSVPEKYKIGTTRNDPKNRVKQLQTGSAEEIVLLREYKSENYKKIENYLKKSYKQYSTDGGTEWFALPSEVAISFTKECKRIDEMFNALKDNPFI
jgi:hypothetical protein